MTEVTRENFAAKFPEIKKSLEKSKLIAVDLEFSALNPLPNLQPSLFDSNKERYVKLKENLEHVIPVQIGITAFHFDPDKNNYFGDVYTFYALPALFANINRSFLFQSSTTNFLCLHKFDFNKFAYTGVPYMNSIEENALKTKLDNKVLFVENSSVYNEFEVTVKAHSKIVYDWYNSATINDSLEIPGLLEKYKNYYESVYFLHKYFRSKFENVWTYEENGSFYIQKVNKDRLQKLSKQCTLDDDLMKDLIGFRHIFKMLASLNKPIIGHNSMQDLMIMINNFERPLPKSFPEFKQLAHSLFPIIFDTKTVFYELRRLISRNKAPSDTSLEGLYNYFKDGPGKELVKGSTTVDCNVEIQNLGSYHEAGWDSFCTGYIFIKMGYFKIYQEYPKSRKFVSSEIIAALSPYKNMVNVIRGSSDHVKIDGQDPASQRPWLVIESKKGDAINVERLASLLSAFGFVDVKKLAGNRMLIAVDSHRTAREISKHLKTDAALQVKHYNTFKHSPIIRAMILTAASLSGTLLIYLARTWIKK